MSKPLVITIVVLGVLVLLGFLFGRGLFTTSVDIETPEDLSAPPAESPPSVTGASGPVAAVSAFFALLAAGDTAAAYRAQAQAAQSEDTEAAFTQAATTAGFTQYASGTWTVRSASESRAALEGTITLKDRRTIPLAVDLVSEGGAWKIRAIGVAQ